MKTSANNRLVARLPRTAFRPGQSGNPRGRTPGTQTRRTIEVRDICNRLVDDPLYLERLRQRLIAGTAGSVEILIWHYAKGKPVDRVETGAPGAFAELTRARDADCAAIEEDLRHHSEGEVTNEKYLMTPDEVAELLRTTRVAIYAMTVRAQMPCVTRIGKRSLVRHDDLPEWPVGTRRLLFVDG